MPGLALGLLLLSFASGCKSGYDYALDLYPGSDPRDTAAALAYFLENEREDLEPETREVLVTVLKDRKAHPLVRAQVAYVLGEVPSEGEHVDLLLEALKNPSYNVRFETVVALGKIGPTADVDRQRKIVGGLIERLQDIDEHPWVRMKSARALASMVGFDEHGLRRPAIEALITAVDDVNESVAHSARSSLAYLTGLEGRELPRDRRAWKEWLAAQPASGERSAAEGAGQ